MAISPEIKRELDDLRRGNTTRISTFSLAVAPATSTLVARKGVSSGDLVQWMAFSANAVQADISRVIPAKDAFTVFHTASAYAHLSLHRHHQRGRLMALVLVPVPTCALHATAAVWQPFVERIARHTRQHRDHLVGQVFSNEVQVHLAWEPETQTAHALAGTRIAVRGDERLGEIVWTTGMGRRRWLPLIADLETYHRDHPASRHDRHRAARLVQGVACARYA